MNQTLRFILPLGLERLMEVERISYSFPVERNYKTSLLLNPVINQI